MLEEVAIRNRQYVRPVITGTMLSRPNRSAVLIEIVIQVRWHSVVQEAIYRRASGGQMRESEFEGRRNLIEIVIQVITIMIH